MSETSTVSRCKKLGSYSQDSIDRIREITTRLEEIRTLLTVYALKHNYGNPHEEIGDYLEKRGRTLRAESAELRAEAEELTDAPLVSKVQAAANRGAAAWYNDAR
jgi:hypothetical protein